MARPTARLVDALRVTAARLRDPDRIYRWSHFAHCNCGHLAQTLTALSPATIYRAAFVRPGDWAAQALAVGDVDHGDRPALDEGAYEPEDMGRCPVANTPMTAIFAQMFDAGLTPDDVGHLERLDDPRVLRRLGKNTTGLAHAVRENVIAYLEAWADLLEERLPSAPPGDDALALAAE